MSLFKSKKVEQKELKQYDKKIKVMYGDGIQYLANNSSCEIALIENNLIINSLSGPDRNLCISISQINSVSVLPWGEYALKYLHTNIATSKNSPGRTYIVINYFSSDNSYRTISFWGAMQLLKIQSFAEEIERRMPSKTLSL